MDNRWLLYALASMVFAGCTSVIAKMGLNGISAELGLGVRTLFVSAFVFLLVIALVPAREVNALRGDNWLWLGLSGLTTALSWIFYYKALKLGDVANVALIDKGSVVVAMLLAWMFLGEAVTWRMGVGCALIVAGLLVIARR
ncbi:EamA family transporter [Oecophyllibacter saccharovorans]|uniref:EamA family transporter n=1 Tax=Oecophyllibacter saccharovorans TaxID=2558360 RepID=A0A506USI4_9PROT|nr:EamA family transporter [Oecophyllibacter saccharovorans]QDH14915.1 EamA family transporter [Oecophyllibacter saccharovorans]TPW35104.1 EamA family transporter [Oecophyllibacter saccharovorans]TPW36053.1 EamA family transporter [Oecophyllibacter saccharovorans]